jgi:hypothetical protein
MKSHESVPKLSANLDSLTCVTQLGAEEEEEEDRKIDPEGTKFGMCQR